MSGFETKFRLLWTFLLQNGDWSGALGGKSVHRGGSKGPRRATTSHCQAWKGEQ